MALVRRSGLRDSTSFKVLLYAIGLTALNIYIVLVVCHSGEHRAQGTAGATPPNVSSEGKEQDFNAMCARRREQHQKGVPKTVRFLQKPGTYVVERPIRDAYRYAWHGLPPPCARMPRPSAGACARASQPLATACVRASVLLAAACARETQPSSGACARASQPLATASPLSLSLVRLLTLALPCPVQCPCALAHSLPPFVTPFPPLPFSRS